MSVSSGSVWGPPPLPDLLASQLADNGRDATDAAQCAAEIFAEARSSPSAALFVELGAHKFLGGDIDGAMASWRHAVSSGEPAPAARALLNLGLLYEQLDLHDRAISVLTSSTRYQVSPDSSQAEVALARCQFATADYYQSMETLARVAQSLMAEPDQTTELGRILLALGDVALEAGRLDRAERSWRAATATPDPATRTEATDRLIRLLRDIGHDDRIPEVIDGLSFAPPTEAAHRILERAGLLADVGRLEQARQLVGPLMGEGLEPTDRFRLADMRLRVGLANAAVDDLEALMHVADPDSQLRAAFNLAEIYRSHEMREPAQAMYRRVVDGGDPYWAARAARALDAAVVVPIGDPQYDAARSEVAAAAPESQPFEPPETQLDNAPDGVDRPPAMSSTAAADIVDDVLPDTSGRSVDVDETPTGDPNHRTARVEEPTTGPVVVLLSSIADDAGETGVSARVAVDSPGGTAFANALGPLDDSGEDADLNESNGSTQPVDLPVGDVAADSAVVPGSGEGVDSDDSGRDRSVNSHDVSAATAFDQPIGPSREPLADDANPYAALAPDPFDGDVAPSKRNPYAELAPRFGGAAASADPAIEDWEAVLDDWPDAPIEDQPSSGRTPRSKAGIFSRYI